MCHVLFILVIYKYENKKRRGYKNITRNNGDYDMIYRLDKKTITIRKTGI